MPLGVAPEDERMARPRGQNRVQLQHTHWEPRVTRGGIGTAERHRGTCAGRAEWASCETCPSDGASGVRDGSDHHVLC